MFTKGNSSSRDSLFILPVDPPNRVSETAKETAVRVILFSRCKLFNVLPRPILCEVPSGMRTVRCLFVLMGRCVRRVADVVRLSSY